MSRNTKSISPLRKRLIDDVQMRKLSPATQASYIRAVTKLTDYLKHSPETATAEELRDFQLHMVNQGVSRGTLNATVTGLRFFFKTTLERPEAIIKITTVPLPRKLPVVLSREEAARLFDAADSPKYKAALSIAYGAGLRISEVIALKISDIERCRTQALGGHVLHCKSCEQTQISYNSCRDRHCPKCQANTAKHWLEARQTELLPVDYYHLVFTLPSPISSLAYYNKSILYKILLQAAAQTLTTIAADPKHLGASIGVTFVLHTWGSAMEIAEVLLRKPLPRAPPFIIGGAE